MGSADARFARRLHGVLSGPDAPGRQRRGGTFRAPFGTRVSGEASRREALTPGSGGTARCDLDNALPGKPQRRRIRRLVRKHGAGAECTPVTLSLIHISEPTRLLSISYAV